MIRASSILFWITLTIVASVALYHTSYRVHELNVQLRELNTAIEAEQRNLHVLKAEWVYLANPARIELAARKFLTMHPTAMKQIARLESLAEILPTRSEQMASMIVNGTPIASIDSDIQPRSVRSRSKSADNSHVNTSMNMQRTASAESSPFTVATIGTGR